ncbi:hypothetical protein AX16_003912 [Volvariella volvacea WC 439]|nr:hypothetical protein AX16_003912 [Volvariella volvacea WC 439]
MTMAISSVEDAGSQQSVAFPSVKGHNQEASSSSIAPTPPQSPSKPSPSALRPVPRVRPLQNAHGHQPHPLPLPYPHLGPTHHLPFRRISLPTSPSAYSLYRQSIVSVESFDSLPDDERRGIGPGPPAPHSGVHASPRLFNIQGQHGRRVRVDSGVSVISSSGSSPGGAKRRNKKKEYDPDKLSTLCRKKLTKRRKIVEEFWETEKAYVDGLELIYSHFLTPIITSLDTLTPILDRASLMTIFSNFIDIWNLHRSFFVELTALLQPYGIPAPGSTSLAAIPIPTSNSNVDASGSTTLPQFTDLPPLSRLLLSHFPYLSLYKPFITSFPNSLSTLTSLSTPPRASRPNIHYNEAFGKWLMEKEQDERCGKLKLRDWLLTVVQRCPRYMLLIKDLIKSFGGNVDEEGESSSQRAGVDAPRNSSENVDEDGVEECERLKQVYALVSKITTSLNTNLQTHAQTLSLLSLQRSTTNLPANFQFISPGRLLLKRGKLLQQEGNESLLKEREVLLFSDCLLWLVETGALEEEERRRRAKRLGGGGSGWGIGWFTGSVQSEQPPLSSNSFTRTESAGVDDGSSAHSANVGASPRLGMGTVRQRSKSDAEVPRRSIANTNYRIRNSVAGAPSGYSASGQLGEHGRSRTTSNNLVISKPIGGSEEKWVFKGKLELVDFEVVVAMRSPRASSHGDEEGEDEMWKFEILSPEGSFVLFAATEEERSEWIESIRSAKAQFLVSLNNTNPHSTLTSSASNNHIRKALRALPYPPNDERLLTVRGPPPAWLQCEEYKENNSSAVGGDAFHGQGSRDALGLNDNRKTSSQSKVKGRRRKVEHWVPAIWIPDDKTEACMRCGRRFGWRRRRHHCRLCGRCVCAACSGKTFFIADTNSKEPNSGKPARACEECYEMAFPVIDTPQDSEAEEEADSSEGRGTSKRVDADTITSLSHFPSWLSMPSLPVYAHQGQSSSHVARNGGGGGGSAYGDYKPQKKARDLMAIDQVSSSSSIAELGGSEVVVEGRRSRLQARVGRGYSHSSSSRPRSTYQILEDFEIHERKKSESEDGNGGPRTPAPSAPAHAISEDVDKGEEAQEFGEAMGLRVTPKRRSRKVSYPATSSLAAGISSSASVVTDSPSPCPSISPQQASSPRKEDTIRRMKRLSLPAVSLHALNVTAHTPSGTDASGVRANRIASRGLSSTSVSVSIPASTSASSSSVALVVSPSESVDAPPSKVIINTNDTIITNATNPNLSVSLSTDMTAMTTTTTMMTSSTSTTPSKSTTSIFKSKRFSLALGSRSQLNLSRPSSIYSPSSPSGGLNASASARDSSVDLPNSNHLTPASTSRSGLSLSTSTSQSKVGNNSSGEKGRLGKGMSGGAAGKLLELLGRRKV